jgi:TPR repeat protein
MWSFFQCNPVARLLPGCFFVASFFSVAVYAAPAAETSDDAPIDAAIRAVDDENFIEAFTLFSQLAESGNAEAQHNLALLYRTGKGVKKDLAASLVWFQRAADQGIPDAQYYLAYMYDNGEGVELNAQKALVWYRKAAEHGQGLAQINLGVIYANGLGVPQDVAQAYLWFHAAAAQGYRVAFENRLVIETALKEQGEPGLARLKLLKKQARGYFQQYVQPFVQPVVPSHNRKPAP